MGPFSGINETSSLRNNVHGMIVQFMMRAPSGKWAMGHIQFTPVVSESTYYPTITSWVSRVDADSGLGGILGACEGGFDPETPRVNEIAISSTSLAETLEATLANIAALLGIPAEGAPFGD